MCYNLWENILLTLKVMGLGVGVKFCQFFLVRRKLPFFGKNCSLPFSLRSLDIPALLKSWQKHYVHVYLYRPFLEWCGPMPPLGAPQNPPCPLKIIFGPNSTIPLVIFSPDLHLCDQVLISFEQIFPSNTFHFQILSKCLYHLSIFWKIGQGRHFLIYDG
jgi:hypothetical protein